MKFSELKNCLDKSGIYKIVNTNTDKVYIGSCVSFIKRLKRHYYYLRTNIHHSKKLQNSWNKHGEDVFIIEYVEFFDETSKDDLKTLEERYIREYDSFKNGYNMTDICYEYNGWEQSEEALANFKKARSKAVIAIDRFTGNYLNTFDSITDAAKEYKTSTSNISRVCKGGLNYIKDIIFVYKEEYDPEKDYIYKDHHMKGVPKPKDTVEKMRRAQKTAIIIYKYDIDDNLIESFYSMKECERQEGFKKDTLRYKLDKRLNSGILYTKNEKLKI